MLRKWEELPEFMKNDEVKKYYEILSRKKFSCNDSLDFSSDSCNSNGGYQHSDRFRIKGRRVLSTRTNYVIREKI